MTAMSRILIVDDDPAAILVLYNALEGMGELCAATSGEEALGLLASHPFDLVLLDVMMPGLDGFVTCRAIRHDHPDLPVLFVTAANDIGNEIRGLGVGGNDFITKPLNPPVVRTRVGNHLKLKAQNDRLRCLSSRDPLTGLANRRALDERLSLEWRLAVRQRQPLALLLVAIDHFQAYTDHYGHLQGDDCLQRVAQALATTASPATPATPAGTLVARYDGEEFAVLLPDSPEEAAVALADRLDDAVRTLAIPHAWSETAAQVTVSIGVASILPSFPPPAAGPMTMAAAATPGESGLQLARELFDRAGRALSAAKRAGGQRVATDLGL